MKNLVRKSYLSCCIAALTLNVTYSQELATDFNFADLNGENHNLYQYLNEGKLVILDFMHAECGPCRSYHDSGTLNNIYNHYGPNGTISPNKVMVLMIDVYDFTDVPELNGANGMSFDWVSDTDYPIINLHADVNAVEGNMVSSYDAWATPTIIKICPTDKKQYNVGYPTVSFGVPTYEASEQGLLEWFHGPSCLNDGTAGIENNDNLELELSINFFPNPVIETVSFRSSMADDYHLRIFNQLGEVVLQQNVSNFLGTIEFDVSNFPSGVYTIQTSNAKAISTHKLMKQ